MEFVNGANVKNFRTGDEGTLKELGNGAYKVILRDGVEKDVNIRVLNKWYKVLENVLEQVNSPVVAFNGDIAIIYGKIQAFLDTINNTHYVARGNTVVAKCSKGNFIEIKIQKKRLIVRVLQNKDMVHLTLNSEEIPKEFKWAFKTAINITDINDIPNVCNEILTSLEIKLG